MAGGRRGVIPGEVFHQVEGFFSPPKIQRGRCQFEGDVVLRRVVLLQGLGEFARCQREIATVEGDVAFLEGLPVPDYRNRRPVENPSYYSYINVPIYAAIAEEEAVRAGVILHYHEFIADVKAVGNYWEIISLGRGIKRTTKAKEIIDCTGDSDVVRMLGLEVLRDEIRQPGAYQYKIEGIEQAGRT